MASYAVPVLESPTPVPPGEILLVASGDLRQSANKVCWAAQAEMEKQLTEALSAEGFTLRRAHPYREDLQHGFIYNQRMGMDVFMEIHPDAPSHCRRSRLAVQPQRILRAAASSRPHPHRGQLVGPVARV